MALRLSGELDLASAPRFRRAVDWLRRRHDQAIILDTTGLTFIDLPGYRALNAALALPDGRRDPRVLYVVGAAVARLGTFLDQAGRAGRAGRRHPPLPPGGPPIDVPA
jgi:anti-anti-sigma factor